MLETLNPLYSLSGFIVGLLVGMTGIGGGSLMTPLLILLFGVHPATAVGTDLLFAAVTKSGGTLFHGIARSIEWRIVGRLAAGSIPVTALTLLTLAQLGRDSGIARDLITGVLAVVLLATAVVLIFRKRILAVYAARVPELSSRQTAVCTVITGGLLGLLVSISSVGAGAIGIVALILLYPRVPTARIIGSDIAHAVPLTFVAGAGHWLLGSTDWLLLGSLLIGSIPGILIGSALCTRVPEGALRTVLAVMLAGVAIKLLF